MSSDKNLDFGDDPVSQMEPAHDVDQRDEDNIWMRGAFMLILALMFSVAGTVLAIGAVLQFGWLLFAKEKNVLIADFGHNLGRWMARVADFQTAKSDDKPFPWDRWGA